MGSNKTGFGFCKVTDRGYVNMSVRLFHTKVDRCNTCMDDRITLSRSGHQASFKNGKRFPSYDKPEADHFENVQTKNMENLFK